MGERPFIMVVDDDRDMLRILSRTLELEGFAVGTATNGSSALALLEKRRPDLVILDVMLPDTDGYAVCRRIREFSPVPIIMVTARGDDEAKVEGLNAGADDYVTKPFSASVLSARVRAVLRRITLGDAHPESAFYFNDLVIDFARHRVAMGGRDVNLTAREYDLLCYLARNTSRMLTPGEILKNVWGKEYVGRTHLLHVNIARLRRKLNDSARNPRYILTKHGIGYMIHKEDITR